MMADSYALVSFYEGEYMSKESGYASKARDCIKKAEDLNDTSAEFYTVKASMVGIENPAEYRNDEFDTLILIFSLTDTRPFLHATYTIKSKFFFRP